LILLGVNAYHADASACLLRDGELIAAAEEERFRRVKHCAGLPVEAVRYCLAAGRVTLSDVDGIAVNQDATANVWRKLRFTLASRPPFATVLDRIRNKARRKGIASQLERALGATFQGGVYCVEHHLAHMASAFLVGPFERAVTVSVDGFGDFASTAWGTGDRSGISVDGRVYFPHSLGIFYQALTQYLGFYGYGDEYKVMGLAPYGRPCYISKMRELVQLEENGAFSLELTYFRHHQAWIDYQWDGTEPRIGTLYSPALERLLGPARAHGEALSQRHKDVARSVQAMYEEAFLHLLNRLYVRYGLAEIALAGGCAMNSVANGKIIQNTPFKRVYVQAAAGDAGGAIGAALQVWADISGRHPKLAVGRLKRRFVMNHAYWGPEYADVEIGELLRIRAAELRSIGCEVCLVSSETALCGRTAASIADGKVVGWFQGRMEWGPRALGNRSILGDPRRANMKDVLNAKIKRRESFRPFAPSILRDAVPEWFEVNDNVPFMMQVYPIRAEKRASIPAVTHVDGSGRLQTVDRRGNERFYKLIEAFRDITDVPMILNTSFNENEPIVCTPEEALACFLRTEMDVLVLGKWYVERASKKIPH
jgi:carbamoyltransferase